MKKVILGLLMLFVPAALSDAQLIIVDTGGNKD